MNKDIFSLIRTVYPSFTNAEKKVADFILKNYNDVIYMSITDLADACNVGESSVFRFCKSINFSGYQEFKIALAHNLTAENNVQALPTEVSLEDSTADLAAKVLSNNIKALNETFNLIQVDEIKRAVKYMVDANRIYFFGVGSSLLTALEAKNKFMRITNKTECSLDSHLQIMSAALLTEDDVAIIISYSGSTKDTLEIAEIIHKQKAKIIAITRFAKSPLTDYADVTLLCGANEGPLQGGSISAKIAQLYLLDVLYFEYYKQTEKSSTINKEKTSKAVARKLL